MAGYVHVYTGEGKGKTTAALGLALRAAGAGWRVFIGQFAKAADTSELNALGRFADRITVRQFGSGRFLHGRPKDEDLDAAGRGMAEARTALNSGDYALVILDEANTGPMLDLFDPEDLLELIAEKPPQVELVLTGRWADPRVVERADLVTEMREVKHYYHAGVAARAGIER